MIEIPQEGNETINIAEYWRPVEEMSDREILIEMLENTRTVADALDKMAQNPTLKAMGFAL